MNLGEIGWVDGGRIGLAQDSDKWGALVNAVMNLGVPQNAGQLNSPTGMEPHERRSSLIERRVSRDVHLLCRVHSRKEMYK
jgi:hypothetical protein